MPSRSASSGSMSRSRSAGRMAAGNDEWGEWGDGASAKARLLPNNSRLMWLFNSWFSNSVLERKAWLGPRHGHASCAAQHANPCYVLKLSSLRFPSSVALAAT